MTSPAYALQVALYTVLEATAFLSPKGAALKVGVYDKVPDDAVFPYWVISDVDELGDLGQGYNGRDLEATLTLWSRAAGLPEAKVVGGQAANILAPEPGSAPPFTLTGHQLVNWEFQSLRFGRDPDGLTSKGILKIKYLTRPTA